MTPLTGALAALAAEAAGKSSAIWLTLPKLATPRAVWHVWHDDALLVVGGGTEQPLPGLAELDTVEVTFRSKENGQRLLVTPATVTVIGPADAGYTEAVAALAADRLNGGSDATAGWAADSTVLRLTPIGPVTEHPGAYPPISHAAPPAPTAAATAPLRPITIHRRAKRRPPLT